MESEISKYTMKETLDVSSLPTKKRKRDEIVERDDDAHIEEEKPRASKSFWRQMESLQPRKKNNNYAEMMLSNASISRTKSQQQHQQQQQRNNNNYIKGSTKSKKKESNFSSPSTPELSSQMMQNLYEGTHIDMNLSSPVPEFCGSPILLAKATRSALLLSRESEGKGSAVVRSANNILTPSTPPFQSSDLENEIPSTDPTKCNQIFSSD